jgi:DNA-binding transcriptional LysR family regulator
MLQDADRLFVPTRAQRGFEPLTSTASVPHRRSDYLDPLFLPELVAQVKKLAPQVRLELLPLSGEFDYRRSLASGAVDLVVGNWLEPPGELHLGKLMSDEIVCLVAETIRRCQLGAVARSAASAPRNGAALDARALPGLRARRADAAARQRARRDRRAPVALGLTRDVMVRSAHFSLIPLMVAQSLLVLTTGRLFCSRYVDALPVRIVRCPVAFPPLTYYQLWHDLTHASPRCAGCASRSGRRAQPELARHAAARSCDPQRRRAARAKRLSRTRVAIDPSTIGARATPPHGACAGRRRRAGGRVALARRSARLQRRPAWGDVGSDAVRFRPIHWLLIGRRPHRRQRRPRPDAAGRATTTAAG